MLKVQIQLQYSTLKLLYLINFSVALDHYKPLINESVPPHSGIQSPWSSRKNPRISPAFSPTLLPHLPLYLFLSLSPSHTHIYTLTHSLTLQSHRLRPSTLPASLTSTLYIMLLRILHSLSFNSHNNLMKNMFLSLIENKLKFK